MWREHTPRYAYEQTGLNAKSSFLVIIRFSLQARPLEQQSRAAERNSTFQFKRTETGGRALCCDYLDDCTGLVRHCFMFNSDAPLPRFPQTDLILDDSFTREEENEDCWRVHAAIARQLPVLLSSEVWYLISSYFI